MGGKGWLVRALSQRYRSGRWSWAAALLGSLSGPKVGGLEHIPSSDPGRGAGARRALGWPGQRADLSSSLGMRPRAARRGGSPGSVRTGTRRPAAQDDIKSPPPSSPAPPRGLAARRGVGGVGAASGSSRCRWEL